MKLYIITALMLISASFTATATETSKLIVYRDAGKFDMSFSVLANNSLLGRLKEGKILSMDVPDGQVIISSSLPGSEGLTLELKAGETAYIDGQLIKTRAGKFVTKFTLTDEKFTTFKQTQLNAAI
jgi:hypothetical protein